MNYYYEVGKIYGSENSIMDNILVKINYRKGKGYEVVAEACHYDVWGIEKLFSPEYYQHYNDLAMLIIPCERKSKKNEQIAEAWLREGTHAYDFAQAWINKAIEQGGNAKIKINNVHMED